MALRSMTGYGRGVLAVDGREITLELKSVNHRFLDIAFRMPRSFSYLEDVMRVAMQEKLARGHVDVFVNYKNLREDARCVRVDTALAKAYAGAMQDVAKACGMAGAVQLTTIAQMPDVLSVIEADEDRDALRALVMQALALALEEMLAMRDAEGLRMQKDMAQRLCCIGEMTQRVAKRAPFVVTQYREKLMARLAEILDAATIEPARIVQEVALFADKVNIDEEITRMHSHIAAMHQAFAQCEPVGRRMDFIVQELNREANTMGSKASDAQLLDAVVGIKGEIEKIREQVQNIE